MLNRGARRTWWAVCLVAASLQSVPAQNARPPITGISHVSVYAGDLGDADHFYSFVLGAVRQPDPQDAAGVRYYLSPTQFVEVLPLPAEHGLSRMARVAYATDDAPLLRSYLISRRQKGVSELHTGSDSSRWFDTRDPEGNEVEFFQHGRVPDVPSSAPIGTRIIHVGYSVRSRAAEDTFYKDLLGFRPYWFGAAQPNALDWVSQQVPDGHDWMEYMMVGDGSDTPLARVDARTLGVQNHFSIGVLNMEKAVTTLLANDRISPRHDGPQMGKDGKWQANLYDPDGTRVELMEFQPVMKPCCSPFTAASPEK